MQKERFWIAMAMIAAPIILALLCVPRPAGVGRGGALEGHVSIDGRPMAGGFILFNPKGNDAYSFTGEVDASGHFRIGGRSFRSDAAEEVPYQICLIPLRRMPRAQPSKPRMEPVHVAGQVPRRVIDPRTSDLEVRLNTGPMTVDIAL